MHKIYTIGLVSLFSLLLLGCGGETSSEPTQEPQVEQNLTIEQDTTKPTITLLGDNPVEITKSSTYEDAGATATDDIDGNITDKLTFTSTVDTLTVGEYAVTYTVKDEAGNEATAVRVVNVKEAEVPAQQKITITLDGDTQVSVLKDTTYEDAGATAVDANGSDLTEDLTVLNYVNTMKAGTYQVTYRVTDEAGNTNETNRTVTVTDPNTAKPWDHGRLVVSENKHDLEHSNGTPFFWMADTAWELSHELTHDEIDTYLQNRKEKGFTVIMFSAVQNKAYNDNVDGELPFRNEDFTDPNGAYWDDIDYIIAKAEELGMYIALLPAWNMTLGEDNRGLTSAEEADAYGRWIADRYKDEPNIIWINGGDTKPEGDSEEIWDALGNSIYDIIKDKHLMTYHPTSYPASNWFDESDEWFNFDTIQTGHCVDYEGGLESFRNAYDKGWALVDIEPRYEAFIKCKWVDDNAELNDGSRFTDTDVRKMAYSQLFSGAFGFTYGHSVVRGFYVEGDVDSGETVTTNWYDDDVINATGVKQMTHLVKLNTSRPFLHRTPDDSIVTSENGIAIRGDGYAFVYLVEGGSVTVDLTKVSSNAIKAYWFDPRTGESTAIDGTFTQGSQTFDSQSQDDMVLVLDDVLRGYDAP